MAWLFNSNKAANKRLEQALHAWRDPRAVRSRASKCQAAKMEARKCIDVVKAANPLEFYGNTTPAGECAGQTDLIHNYPDEFARYKYAPGGLQKLKQMMIENQVKKLSNIENPIHGYTGYGEYCANRAPRITNQGIARQRWKSPDDPLREEKNARRAYATRERKKITPARSARR